MGLICLSGGRRGWIERYLRGGDYAAAQAYAGRLAGLFDQDAYLTLELHAAEDETIAAQVVGLARRLGIGVAAVQPVYCLAAEDASRLRLLAAIRQNVPLAATPVRSEEPTAAVPIWLSPGEIAQRFARFGGAVEMAGEIAARCGDCLPDGRPIWPGLKLPAGMTPDSALADLAQAGLTVRYGDQPAASVPARLSHELEAIGSHGYAPLFLVVADVVQFARAAGVPVSTRWQRGEFPGSLLRRHHDRRSDGAWLALRAVPQPGARQPARY